MADVAPELLVSRSDGILRLTLNRPAAANAITTTMREDVIEEITAAADDEQVRVIVIAANGKHFCAGADVSGIGAQDRVGGGMRRLMMRSQRLVAAIFDSHKPVIAQVQGAAAGLGAHIALACDMVVAAEEAAFIEVFVNRGISVDAGGAWLLPRLVGLQKAKELVFLGDRVSGAVAKEIGLVNRVVPAVELDATVTGLAQRVAAGPTLAIALSKRLLNASFETDRGSAFAAEAMAQDIASRSEDAKEGIQSFTERRNPDFKGY